jgi:hypothetical protein
MQLQDPPAYKSFNWVRNSFEIYCIQFILLATKYIYAYVLRVHLSPRLHWDPPPPSRKQVCPPPSGRGDTLDCTGEGVGNTNSDDWRKSLALGLLCAPSTRLKDNLLDSLPAGCSAGSRRRARRAWSLPASGAAQSPPPHPPARHRATAQTDGLILRYLLPHCHCTAGQCRTNPWPAVPDWPWGRTEFVDYR